MLCQTFEKTSNVIRKRRIDFNGLLIRMKQRTIANDTINFKVNGKLHIKNANVRTNCLK